MCTSLLCRTMSSESLKSRWPLDAGAIVFGQDHGVMVTVYPSQDQVTSPLPSCFTHTSSHYPVSCCVLWGGAHQRTNLGLGKVLIGQRISQLGGLYPIDSGVFISPFWFKPWFWGLGHQLCKHPVRQAYFREASKQKMDCIMLQKCMQKKTCVSF